VLLGDILEYQREELKSPLVPGQEREGHQDADERQDVDVLVEGRIALGDRNEAALEPQHVGEDERRAAEQRIGADVERDEQPVVASHHR
jgi:hypothetical protein